MALAFFILTLCSLVLLIAGMVKPTKVLLGENATRSKVAKVYGLAIPIFLIAFVVAIPKEETAKAESKNQSTVKANEQQTEAHLYQFSGIYPGLSADQVKAQGFTVCRPREKSSNVMECRPKEINATKNQIGALPISDAYASFEPPYSVVNRVVIILGKRKEYNKQLPKNDPFYENDVSPSYDEVERELSKILGPVVSTRRSLTWHHGTKETVSYRNSEIEIYLSDYNSKEAYEQAMSDRQKRMDSMEKEKNAKSDFINSMK